MKNLAPGEQSKPFRRTVSRRFSSAMREMKEKSNGVGNDVGNDVYKWIDSCDSGWWVVLTQQPEEILFLQGGRCEGRRYKEGG